MKLNAPLPEKIYPLSYLQKMSEGLKVQVAPGDSCPLPVDRHPLPCKTAWDRQVRSVALQRRYTLQQAAAGECRALTPYKQVLGAGYVGIMPVRLMDSEIRTVTATQNDSCFMTEYHGAARQQVRRLLGSAVDSERSLVWIVVVKTALCAAAAAGSLVKHDSEAPTTTTRPRRQATQGKGRPFKGATPAGEPLKVLRVAC